jgi:hypothetical protein
MSQVLMHFRRRSNQSVGLRIFVHF